MVQNGDVKGVLLPLAHSTYGGMINTRGILDMVSDMRPYHYHHLDHLVVIHTYIPSPHVRMVTGMRMESGIVLPLKVLVYIPAYPL